MEKSVEESVKLIEIVNKKYKTVHILTVEQWDYLKKMGYENAYEVHDLEEFRKSKIVKPN